MSATDDAGSIVRALACGQPRCPCARADRRGYGLTHCPVHQDNTPSFNVSVRGDTLLAFCHSGSCSQETVIQTLRERDLWPEHEDQARYGNKIELDNYEYRDEQGTVLFEVVRYFPKGFSQRHRSGTRTVWNLEGVRRVLYKLPELLAADPRRTRFVVEGEKDVNRLVGMDIVATCNPGGAGKWRDEYTPFFENNTVVVVVDNDDKGREHARDVARSLLDVARRVLWLELPELDEHGDISDWFDDGGTKEQLQELIKHAPPPPSDVHARREPELTQSADEIFYSWPDDGLTCTFSRLRETDGGAIKGFIEVQSNRPDSQGLVTWQSLTLTNQTDKDRLAKKLVKVSTRDEDIWAHAIEIAFQDVSRAFSTVPPPIDLADVAEAVGSGYLFRPIVPLGQVVEFLADQGTTKSYLMMYLLLCTVTGRESIFGEPARVGPCIYFDWEVDQQTARRRLGWILRGLGLSDVPRGLHYVNMSDRGKLIDRARDMRHQIATTGAVAVAIDSLTFATGGDLTATEMSAPTMSAIGGLGEGVTKLVCTHPPKAVRRGNGADVSAVGSGLFEFRARGIWYLQRPKDFTPSFVVSMTQHKLSDDERYGPLFYRVSFDRNRQAVSFASAQPEDEPELAESVLSTRERIRMYLRGQPAHQGSVAQVARALGIHQDTARKCFERWRPPNEVQQLSGSGNTGVWLLVAPQPTVNGQYHPEPDTGPDTPDSVDMSGPDDPWGEAREEGERDEVPVAAGSDLPW